MRIDSMPSRDAAGAGAGFCAADENAVGVSFLSMIGEARTLMRESQHGDPASGRRAEPGRDTPEHSDAPASPAHHENTGIPVSDSEAITSKALDRSPDTSMPQASPAADEQEGDSETNKNQRPAIAQLDQKISSPVKDASERFLRIPSPLTQAPAVMRAEPVPVMNRAPAGESSDGVPDPNRDVSWSGSHQKDSSELGERESYEGNRKAATLTSFGPQETRAPERAGAAARGAWAVDNPVGRNGDAEAAAHHENTGIPVSDSEAITSKALDRSPDTSMPQASPAADKQVGNPETNECQKQPSAHLDQGIHAPVKETLERFLRIPSPPTQAPAAVGAEPVPVTKWVSGGESPEGLPAPNSDVFQAGAHQKDSLELGKGESHEGCRNEAALTLFGPKENQAPGRIGNGAKGARAVNNPADGNNDAEAAALESLPQSDSFERTARYSAPGAEWCEETRQESRPPERFHLPTPAVAGREVRTSFQSAGPAAKAATPEAMALYEPDFLSRMAQHVQIHVKGGDGIVQIQLKPQLLGRLEIRAETSSGGVRATIITESQSVRDFLEQNLHALRQSFQDQGLRIDRVQITVADPSVSDHSPGGQSLHQPAPDKRRELSQGSRRGVTAGEEDLEHPVEQPRELILRPHSTFHTVA